MKLVGATFRYRIDLSGAAAVLRSVGIGLDLELLDFVDGRNGGDSIEIGRSIDGAVEKEIGVLSAGPAHGVLVSHAPADVADFLKCSIAVFCKGNTWPQCGEIEEASAIQW